MSRTTAAYVPENRSDARGAFPIISSHPSDEVRHDLSSSDSETLSLASLLSLAQADDRMRWEALDLGYTDPRGTPRLREMIAQRHARLGADDVVVCAGAQEALSSVVRALLSPADHAVVILPIYPPSERAVTDVCAAAGVPLSRGKEWRLDLDDVAAALRPNTKLVVTNFPNSPTGATLDRAELDDLVALCRRHGLWLMNDEVYLQTDLSEADRPLMLADVYERGVSINGLSKGFGLPGLRIGWVACSDQSLLARVVAKSAPSSCVAATSEVLATMALRAESTILARTRDIGHRNRERLTAVLNKLPHLFGTNSSRNLAFAFPRYKGSDGCDELARKLLQRAGLHVLPASLWNSPLATLPIDHVRIALGHAKNGPALDVLGDFLSSSR